MIIQHYFKKRRIIANGICLAGFAAGTALFGMVSGIIIQEITWRNTLILLAALNVQILVASSFFFPKRLDQCITGNDGGNQKIDVEEVTVTVTNIEDADHGVEHENNSRCCDKVRHFIIDFSIFRNIAFALYFTTFIPASSSTMSFLQLGPNRAYVQGIDRVSSNYVTTAIGSCSFFGRLFSGVIGNQKFIASHIHFGISACCAGVFVILSVLAKGSLALHLLFAGLFGFSMGMKKTKLSLIMLPSAEFHYTCLSSLAIRPTLAQCLSSLAIRPTVLHNIIVFFHQQCP